MSAMDALGLATHFMLNAALCIAFWTMLARIAKDTRTSQVISFISLSVGFVFLTAVSVIAVNVIFGPSRGSLENMTLVVLSTLGSVVVTPIMLVVGLVRLAWLVKAGADATQGP